MEHKSGIVWELASFLSGEAAAVVGVGNADRGDDGFGPAVVALLRRANPAARQRQQGVLGPCEPRLLLIDAGIRPENCLEAVAESGVRRVLFVDAAGCEECGMEGEAQGEAQGEAEGGGKESKERQEEKEGAPCLELLDPSELVGTSVSTHRLPLALVAKLLQVETGAEVKVLAYRVRGDGRLERFAGLSAGARRAASGAATAFRAATALREVGRGTSRHA